MELVRIVCVVNLEDECSNKKCFSDKDINVSFSREQKKHFPFISRPAKT